MPGLPLLACTRRNACLQFSRSQTSSIHCSLVGLSALRFANSDSVPPTEAIGAAPLLSSAKARRYWLCCHLPARPNTACLASSSCSSARVFAPRFFQTSPRGSALALCYHFTSIWL